MARVAAIATIVAVAVVSLPAAQFRAGVAVVRLPVVVTDRHGLAVRGLTAADFEVLDEGKPQPIAYFTEGALSDSLPLYLGLLLDTSDSMGEDLRDAADAAVRFVRELEAAKDTTFVDFDTAVRLGRFEPASYPTLFERIRSRTAKGYTAFYDALGVYIESASRRDGQHVLVMYTDGGDTMSRLNFGDVQNLLRLGNVVVYALGYLDHQSSSTRMTQQTRLTQLARDTGGEAYFPSSRADLDRVYTRIREELLFRYTLGYTAPAGPSARPFRRIEVRVVRPDVKGASVRTRAGYLAGR